MAPIIAKIRCAFQLNLLVSEVIWGYGVGLNGGNAVLQGGFPVGTSADAVAIDIIEMPYPVILYTREPDEIFVFGGTPFGIEEYVSRADGLPTGENET